MQAISDIRCFVLDMDGTIYLGKDLFPCTKPFLSAVERMGRKYYFFTNNSSKSQQVYLDRLARYGIPVTREQMMTSSHVIMDYLREKHPGEGIYLVGTPALWNEFSKAGMPLTDEHPSIVILGFDTTLTYEKLERACYFLRHGCTYYAINQDWNCPIEGGEFIPDCGSMAKLIEASTGRKPEFFGKPTRHTMDYIVRHTGCRPEEIAVVGDRLYTDIAVTQGTGAKSILVLTGETKREDVEKSSVQPDIIVESLADITGSLLQADG